MPAAKQNAWVGHLGPAGYDLRSTSPYPYPYPPQPPIQTPHDNKH